MPLLMVHVHKGVGERLDADSRCKGITSFERPVSFIEFAKRCILSAFLKRKGRLQRHALGHVGKGGGCSCLRRFSSFPW